MGLFLLMKLRLIPLLNLMHKNIMTGLKLSLIIFPMLLQVLQRLLKFLLRFRQRLFGGLSLLLEECVFTLPESFVTVVITGGFRKGLFNFKVELFILLHIILQENQILAFIFLQLLNLLLVLLDLVDMFTAHSFGLVLEVLDLFTEDCLLSF